MLMSANNHFTKYGHCTERSRLQWIVFVGKLAADIAETALNSTASKTLVHKIFVAKPPGGRGREDTIIRYLGYHPNGPPCPHMPYGMRDSIENAVSLIQKFIRNRLVLAKNCIIFPSLFPLRV